MNRRTFLKSTVSVCALPMWSKPLHLSSMPLRVGIIGHTGRGNYGHGLDVCFVNRRDCSIVAVADVDPSGLQNAGKRLGNPALYEHYSKMLHSERVDLVSIAPRHIDQHAEMALTAIRSGVKGIYMEKPFCRNLSEANLIKNEAEKHHVKIALAHRNRYHPAFKQVQQLLEEEFLGEVLEIRTRGKEDHRGGVQDLWVLGSHVLNLADVLSGGLTAVAAVLYQDKRMVSRSDIREGEEGIGPIAGNQLHARFETKKGYPVFFDSIRGKGRSEANFGIQVIGTKGVLDIRIDTEPLVHYLPGNIHVPRLESKNWVMVSSGGVGVPEPINSIGQNVANHQVAIDDLIQVMGTEDQPLCSLDEGIQTIRAIMGVLSSHCEGGRRVSLSDVPMQNPLQIWK